MKQPTKKTKTKQNKTKHDKKKKIKRNPKEYKLHDWICKLFFKKNLKKKNPFFPFLLFCLFVCLFDSFIHSIGQAKGSHKEQV
jgi:hypothetical protein